MVGVAAVRLLVGSMTVVVLVVVIETVCVQRTSEGERAGDAVGPTEITSGGKEDDSLAEEDDGQKLLVLEELDEVQVLFQLKVEVEELDETGSELDQGPHDAELLGLELEELDLVEEEEEEEEEAGSDQTLQACVVLVEEAEELLMKKCGRPLLAGVSGDKKTGVVLSKLGWGPTPCLASNLASRIRHHRLHRRLVVSQQPFSSYVAFLLCAFTSCADAGSPSPYLRAL